MLLQTLLDPCCLACIVPIRVGKDTSARSAQDCMVVLAYALERGAGRRMTSLIVDPDRASMGFGLVGIISLLVLQVARCRRPCPKGWLTRELTDRFCVAPAPLRATGVGVGRPVRRSVEVAQCSRDHSESDVNGFIKWMQPLCLAFSYVKCWNIRIFFLSSF